MYSKRRTRGRRISPMSRTKRIKPNYLPVVLILALSIGCGYATAKYVVEPVVNYVPQLTAQEDTKEAEKDKESEESKESGETKAPVVEDDVKVKDTAEISGYALQFGCYSTKEAAEKAMTGLNMTGLSVLEQNQMFKIVGETYKTKKEAKAALTELPDPAKAFVTTIYQ